MDYKKEIGRRIRKARLERELTLEQLAAKTGDRLTLKRISAYENGDRMPGPGEAVTLAKALALRPAYVMALDDPQLPITDTEELMIKNWRKLPERDRMGFYRQIEQVSMAYTDTPITSPQSIKTPNDNRPLAHAKKKT